MQRQKPIVHKIYIDLVNEKDWIKNYRETPDEILNNYGLNQEYHEKMKKILEMF